MILFVFLFTCVFIFVLNSEEQGKYKGIVLQFKVIL
jgi:hypothetical protein